MKLLITWILIFASTLVWGMEKQQWPKTIPTNNVITVESESIQKEEISPSVTISLNTKEVKSAEEEEKIPVTIIDISTRTNETLYFLTKKKNKGHYVFRQNKRQYPLEKIKEGYTELYKILNNDYIAFQYKTNKNLLIPKDETLKGILQAQASHNHPIITFGTISDVLFTGSTWPSIKKVNFKNTSNNHPNQSIPFLNNAFLLACSDNGMVIAKVNEIENWGFYFWRRFNTFYPCNVTLYALFFNERTIDTIDKKLIQDALTQAEKSKKDTSSMKSTAPFTARENLLNFEKDITVIPLVENVQLTADELKYYAKKLPKAAVGNNCAVVVHTQKGPTLTKDNPMISFVYKNNNRWHVKAETLKDFLGKKRSITHQDSTPYPINHPNLYEIKDLYLYRENNTPTVLLISKTNQLGFWADGVYKVVLESKVKGPSLYWHVPLEINKKSLYPTEQIVAATFNKASHTLYLATNNQLKDEKVALKQWLVTLDMTKKKPAVAKK